MTVEARRLNVTGTKIGAVLTVKILAMKEHLKLCRKDISSKRRLEAIISQRYKMLKYLRKKVFCFDVESASICRNLQSYWGGAQIYQSIRLTTFSNKK